MDEDTRNGGDAPVRPPEWEHWLKSDETIGMDVVNIRGWRWLPTMKNLHAKDGRAIYSTDLDGERWMCWLRPDGEIWQDPDGCGYGCPDIRDEATGLQMARLAGLAQHIVGNRDGWCIQIGEHRGLDSPSIGHAVAVFVLTRGYWTRGGA